ncbi:bifunctional methylenetetrahydrofolate dehydrogenase/methenyltetrahydrofolate cyclohydrolase, partial [Pseudomaricurvus alkylphenolicus]|uniref:bifunctional 5,10-methylenetetrahydrofolate dehydrogenase/5,10-methenyltetrahydrofolate cyclohydrolase n=1 Tax=Pseudomaricurvus alkylphenolicus TaxID=1306991 RepID=UPI0014216DB1
MIIDGKATAQQLRDNIAAAIDTLKQQHNLQPGLAVVLVGEDPASQVYVRNKGRQTLEVGMNSLEFKLPAETSESELLTRIGELNADPSVNGILVQLPLPDHINETAIIEAIAPEKDVDGFHAVNSGKLMNGEQGALVPCTPQGCVMLAKQHLGDNLSGKHAVVIGRSNIVGKPVSMLLLQESCTVTVCHSRTRNLA